jgi:hypothetical protein
LTLRAGRAHDCRPSCSWYRILVRLSPATMMEPEPIDAVHPQALEALACVRSAVERIALPGT